MQSESDSPPVARPPAAGMAAAGAGSGPARQRAGEPPPPLRLLVVEDSDLDHDLLVATLQREGLRIEPRRVETASQLADALTDGTWDAVISDHQLPGFSSLAALDMVRASAPYCPFIIVSGVMGEDAAVAAMRRGADDYLVKDRLARLVPALVNAMAAADARRERALAEQALLRSESQLRALLSHLETVIDDERAEIAREIHDDVGAALTALRLDMNWIIGRGDDASATRARDAMRTLAQVMGTTLRLQQRLRPAVLDQGLVAALSWLADDAARRAGLAVSFRSNVESLEPSELDPAIAVAAYRTLQEALTNVIKHAGARGVHVDLIVGTRDVSLEIADDGRGLQPADRTRPTAFGLRGMAERASRLGGWVDIDGRAGSSGTGGTVVLLSLPRRAAPAAVS